MKKIYMMPAYLAIGILKIYEAGNENRFFENVFYKLMKECEKKASYFMSFNLRPKKSEGVTSIEKGKYDYSEIAIVIQGPLVHEEAFTYETIKTYKKIFPNAPVIVSCWDNEEQEYVEEIKKLGGGYLFY